MRPPEHDGTRPAALPGAPRSGTSALSAVRALGFALAAAVLLASDPAVARGSGTQAELVAEPPSAGPPVSDLDAADLDAAEFVRVEYFALWLPAAPGAADDNRSGTAPPKRRCVGRALVRRIVEDDRSRCELEVSFADADVRALFLERDGPTGRFLVARELLPRGGRSVALQSLDEGRWRRNSWGRHGLVRSMEAAHADDVGLPGLFERARSAPVSGAAAELRCFDLLADAWVDVRLTVGLVGEPGSERRRVEARAADQDLLVGWFVFERSEFVAFGWQAGGLYGERVTADDWRELESVEPRESGQDEAAPGQ